ncbi:DUF6168 family protein [uncultured Psychroserpens sp.]|uniref:DUF6168 family protein n=1 Tax=uncultured Psychroserpens sp. TaxID=255436 RepID=UPI0026350C65|nr:DUF6168 family protein [uncultured Psychroserpens sp.]
MSPSVLNFSIKLIFVLTLAFGIHLLALHYLEHPLFENKIVMAYLINGVLAILIYAFLFKMKDKLERQIGFLFIGGSLLKFVVFFILFYASYKADGNISRLEFTAFFVPYLLCLIIETMSLAKWLNKLE